MVEVNWVMAETVDKELRAWLGICGKEREKKLIQMTPLRFLDHLEGMEEMSVRQS